MKLVRPVELVDTASAVVNRDLAKQHPHVFGTQDNLRQKSLVRRSSKGRGGGYNVKYHRAKAVLVKTNIHLGLLFCARLPGKDELLKEEDIEGSQENDSHFFQRRWQLLLV